jgi:glucose/arabinose dehydrogenase
MDNRIKFVALAALLGCAAAYAGDQAPAQQQQPAAPQQQQPAAPPSSDETMAATHLPEFSTLDVNGDGVVSQEEAKGEASLSAIFSDVDANHDGKLDSREYAEARNRLEK